MLTYCAVGQHVQISQYGLHVVGTVVHLVLVAGAVLLLWVARRRAVRESAAV